MTHTKITIRAFTFKFQIRKNIFSFKLYDPYFLPIEKQLLDRVPFCPNAQMDFGPINLIKFLREKNPHFAIFHSLIQ